MSRSMRNAVQPHMRTAPCRMKCGNKDVPQLQGGKIVDHPICDPCRSRLNADFQRANIQRSKQEVRPARTTRSQGKQAEVRS